MQITALLQVINYLRELTGNQSFMEMYRELAVIIKEASKNPGENNTAEILKLKDRLQAFLLDNDPTDWGYSSYSLFEKINSNNLFGRPAAEYLENVLNHGSTDYKAMHTEVSKTIRLLGNFSENITKFSNLFDTILPPGEIKKDEKTVNSSSIFLYFEGHLSVQAISDLERYSRIWDSILESFCSLTGENNPSVEICNFSNGNIVLGVAAGENTLKAFAGGINDIVPCLTSLLKIKKIQQEMIQLPLNTDMIDMLEAETENIIDKTASESASRLIAIYSGENEDFENLHHDISRSLKQVLSFIEKGGKIEYNTNCYSDVKSIRNLSESFLTARELDKLTSSVYFERQNRAASHDEHESAE